MVMFIPIIGIPLGLMCIVASAAMMAVSGGTLIPPAIALLFAGIL
jgi:hypothetical protein